MISLLLRAPRRAAIAVIFASRADGSLMVTVFMTTTELSITLMTTLAYRSAEGNVAAEAVPAQ
jgi:hypothetical protein